MLNDFFIPYTFRTVRILNCNENECSNIFSEADNLLGFSKREARLAERVREVEEQNLILRRQLSISQNQLVSLISDAQSKKNGQTVDENSNFTASLLPPGLRPRKQNQAPCREVRLF